MDCSVTVLHCVVYMEEEKRMKLIAPIAKSQHMREIWFHVMSGGVMLKIVVMVCSLTACGQQENGSMTNTGNSTEQVVASGDNSELATAEDNR